MIRLGNKPGRFPSSCSLTSIGLEVRYGRGENGTLLGSVLLFVVSFFFSLLIESKILSEVVLHFESSTYFPTKNSYPTCSNSKKKKKTRSMFLDLNIFGIYVQEWSGGEWRAIN